MQYFPHKQNQKMAQYFTTHAFPPLSMLKRRPQLASLSTAMFDPLEARSQHHSPSNAVTKTEEKQRAKLLWRVQKDAGDKKSQKESVCSCPTNTFFREKDSCSLHDAKNSSDDHSSTRSETGPSAPPPPTLFEPTPFDLMRFSTIATPSPSHLFLIGSLQESSSPSSSSTLHVGDDSSGDHPAAKLASCCSESLHSPAPTRRQGRQMFSAKFHAIILNKGIA